MFFKDSAKIKWKGEEYTCPINMKSVKIMESNGFNAAVTNAQCSSSVVPPISLLAEMVYWLLLFGGCKDKELSEDAVYAELMNNSMDDANVEIMKSAKALSELFIPKIDTAERVTSGEKKK